MVFAGAIEFSTGEIALILSILAAVALGIALTGALLAWVISRRRIALPLGATAIYVGGWLGSNLGPMGSAIVGLLASMLVGFLLRPAGVPR